MPHKGKIKDAENDFPIKDQEASKDEKAIPETREELDQTELDKVSGGGKFYRGPVGREIYPDTTTG